MNGIGHHYYTLPRGNWEKKGAATGFPEAEWLSTFANTIKIEDYIKSNVAIMDEHDPEKKVGFYVDEWGTWYDAEEGDNPAFLYQQNTLRDALLTGLNFNIFHKYADRVRMTNIAQMVNVLQAMILTDKEKMLLTPTYHAFKMYVPFQQATHLPVDIADNPSYGLGETNIPQVSASAAKTVDGQTVLALINVHPTEAADIVINSEWKQGEGQILTGEKMDAHNTFANKDAVKPRPFSAVTRGNQLIAELPPKSMVVLRLQ